MRIRFNSQTSEPLQLTFQAREMQPDGTIEETPTIDGPMAPVEFAPGLFEIDATPAIGNYHVHIFGSGYETTLFLCIASTTKYNLSSAEGPGLDVDSSKRFTAE